jgi:hypothetical protein
MAKSLKKNNLLIKKEVKQMFLEKSLKIGNGSLEVLNWFMKNLLERVVNESAYSLELQGRSVVREDDLKEIFDKLEKEKVEVFEV